MRPPTTGVKSSANLLSLHHLSGMSDATDTSFVPLLKSGGQFTVPCGSP